MKSTVVDLAILDKRRRQRVRVHRQSARLWQRPRIRDFWERDANEEFTDELWIRHFSLTPPPPATFNHLCDAMGTLVAPKSSCPQEAVPTQKRVAIGLTGHVTAYVKSSAVKKCEKKTFPLQFCDMFLY